VERGNLLLALEPYSLREGGVKDDVERQELGDRIGIAVFPGGAQRGDRR
jgi:hypothetical protein